MTIPSRLARLTAAALATGALAITIAQTSAPTMTWAGAAAAGNRPDLPLATRALSIPRLATATGPSSPWGRRPAPTVTRRFGGVVVTTFDLGDVTLPGSRFRSPVRGTLVLPATGRHLGLVVLLRGRPAGCTHGVHAFPCPAGTHEVRSDVLLVRDAAALARTGRAVLVPDVAPVTVSPSPSHPYSRARAVQMVLDREVAALGQAAAGARSSMGPHLAGRVDVRHTSVRKHA